MDLTPQLDFTQLNNSIRYRHGAIVSSCAVMPLIEGSYDTTVLRETVKKSLKKSIYV